MLGNMEVFSGSVARKMKRPRKRAFCFSELYILTLPVAQVFIHMKIDLR